MGFFVCKTIQIQSILEHGYSFLMRADRVMEHEKLRNTLTRCRRWHLLFWAFLALGSRIKRYVILLSLRTNMINYSDFQVIWHLVILLTLIGIAFKWPNRPLLPLEYGIFTVVSFRMSRAPISSSSLSIPGILVKVSHQTKQAHHQVT